MIIGSEPAAPTAGGALRLVLCDDHPLLVDALAAELKRHGHDVVAVVADGDEASAAVAALHPDLFVVGLAGESAVEMVRRVGVESPRTRVLLVVATAGPAEIAAAVAAGACGIVRKDRGIVEVLQAVAAVAAGESVLDVGTRRLPAGREAVPADDLAVAALRNLTGREQEVLRRVVRGETTKQIAKAMGVTPSTTRTHVQNLLAKLGVLSRVDAAALVARNGLFPLPPD